MKKTVSFLLILCLIFAMNFGVSAAANISFSSTTPVTDDFETIDTTNNKPYGTSASYLKTKDTNWGLVDVDTTDAETNNSLYLQAAADATPVMYDLGASMGTYVTGFFKISMDIFPYDNSTNRIFYLRTNATTYVPVIKFNTMGQIVWLNEGNDTGTFTYVADYNKNEWVKLTLYYDTTANSCSVYIGDTLKGVFTLSSLNQFRTIRFAQNYNAINESNPDRMSKVAIDNLYIGYETKTLHSNVANGATDIDLDKEFKFYATKNITTLNATIGATALTTTVRGNTASAVLPSKLEADTTYILAVGITYEDGTSASDIINFTTGSGAARTNALNINFEGIGTTADDVKASYGDGTIALTGNSVGDKDVSTYFSVADTNGVNGNALKINPENNLSSINYDFNAILPYAVKENTVVVEFDRYDTTTENRGPAKILNATGNVTKFLTEYASSDIKVYADGSNSSIKVRPLRPKDNVFNEHKYVINYDATTGKYTYSFYINGVLQGSNSVYAQDVNIGSMENIGRLTLQLWGRTAFTDNDFVQYDNIRISYNSPVVSAKVGSTDITEISALNAGETLTASATGTSVFADVPMLIMAVYKDGLLDSVDFTDTVEWTVPEDIQTGNYKVVVMLWDGFENIIPLTNALVID